MIIYYYYYHSLIVVPTGGTLANSRDFDLDFSPLQIIQYRF